MKLEKNFAEQMEEIPMSKTEEKKTQKELLTGRAARRQRRESERKNKKS